MGINPIMTTIVISTIASVCANSSDRSSTTTTTILLLLLWLASILSSVQIIVVRTSTRTNAANSTITTFIPFTSIRFNTIAFTSTIRTTIMIIVIVTTISISVAVTTTLPSFIVLIHITMTNTICCYHCHTCK